MAKLNHAKIIKGFEELINTTNGKDFFVGFLKTFSFPASTIRNVQDPNRECQDFCVWGGYSRGSPTRLPFVFEMQYARPDAIAREV